MALKYSLIASNKVGYGFSDEIELEKYSRIEDIDYISCVYENQGALIRDLEKDGILCNHNHLAIRYKKNGEYKYIKPLYDCPQMRSVIDGIKEVTIITDKYPAQYRVVSNDDKFVNKIKSEFINDINRNIDELFYEIYEGNAGERLQMLAYRYHGLNYDNDESLEDIYQNQMISNQLDVEFRNYRNFRNYIYFVRRYFNKKEAEQSFYSTSLPLKEKVETIVNVLPTNIVPQDLEKEEFLTVEDFDSPQYEEIEAYGYKKY